MGERKFGDKTFKVEPLLATNAVRLQARLFKVAGPAIDKLPEVLAGAGKADADAKARSDAAAIAAFSEIFNRSDPDEIAELVKDVAETAMIKQASGSYTQVDFDQVFTGNSAIMFPVLVWILKEHFGDFFSGVLANGRLKTTGNGG